MSKRKAFSWYGGKFSTLNFLLPLFPDGPKTFVDVFGGSAAVVLNVDFPIRVYNDLNRGVVHFFRTLRDDGEALIRHIELTPYSREEYALAVSNEDGISDIEKARRFFVYARSSYGGGGRKATPSDWSHSVTASSRGMPHDLSRWLSTIDSLPEVVGELRTIQIENRPAINLIPKYDTPDTLFYCDPPYIPATRRSANDYVHEMSIEDHRDLAAALAQIKGKAVVSGYRSDLYDEIYSDWRMVCDKAKQINLAVNRGKSRQDGSRQECAWLNW